MKQLNFLITIGILFLYNTIYAQFTDEINSNRPGESIGAYSLGKNVFQGEGGLYYIHEGFRNLNYYVNGAGMDVSVRAGLLREQLEFMLDAKFQVDQFNTIIDSVTTISSTRSGLRKTLLGAKYLIYDPFRKKPEKPNIHSWRLNHKFKWKQLIPAFSIYVGAHYTVLNNYAVPNESAFSPKVMLITQNHFQESWVVVTNLFYDKISSINSNLGFVVTVTKGLGDKWSIFLEDKGIQGEYYSDNIITGGTTYLLKNNIQLDLSISKNLKRTPGLFYGGLGVSWRFDKKHKDVKLQDGKVIKAKADEEPSGKRLDDIEGNKIKPE